MDQGWRRIETASGELDDGLYLFPIQSVGIVKMTENSRSISIKAPVR